ncbi:MAG: ABC transporter permease [Planctomycetes bacterium]|jgi:putative ABC transport system permease protein|nr:ABC transporter permease [Planctomycetota bacterium]
MFRTNRSRTVLTILGISVGIGAILFLVSLGYGLQMLILNQITTSDALLSLDVSTGDLTNLKLDEDSISEIRSIPGVEKVSPLVSAQAQMMIGDISSELVLNFVDREYLRLDGTVLKQGEYYSEEEKDRHKIIISSSALKLFNLSVEEALAKKIKFTVFITRGEENNIVRDFVKLDGDFSIIGIIDEEDSNYVYMPFAVGVPLQIGNYSKLKVKVDSDKNLDYARTAIIEKGFIVSALSDIIEQANQVFQIVQVVLASFGIIALIVSAIGMFNTMTIALLERTQEIGIMKALGATNLDIWNMFLAESVIIGFFGGVGGIIIGMAGGEVFNYGINFLAGFLGGAKIDMFYTPYWFVAVIMTFSTFVGLLTGFYPARRAARINALEALRYK